VQKLEHKDSSENPFGHLVPCNGKREIWVKGLQIHNQALPRVNPALKRLLKVLENSLHSSVALLQTGDLILN